MLAEITRNIHYLAMVRYPRLRNIPKYWSMIVKFFENYISVQATKLIYRVPPNMGVYKCNLDGASKGNPGPSARGFYIKNWNEEFISAAAQELEQKSLLLKEDYDFVCQTIYYL